MVEVQRLAVDDAHLVEQVADADVGPRRVGTPAFDAGDRQFGRMPLSATQVVQRQHQAPGRTLDD